MKKLFTNLSKKKILIISLSIFLVICISVTIPLCLLSSKHEDNKIECQHNESNWTIITNPTCTTAGIKMLSCDKCEEKTAIIPATGHNWTEATCTKTKFCSNCNLTEGSALGHSYTTTVVSAPTCLKTGTNKLTCSKCQDSYTETVSAKGHTYTHNNSTKVDSCKNCSSKGYIEISARILSKLCKQLKDPSSAVVHSIYAGPHNFEGVNSIVVIISLSAKNSFGAMVKSEYLSLYALDSGKYTLDLVGTAEEQAEYYQKLADRAFGKQKLEYLDYSIAYNKLAISGTSLLSKKTTLFKSQDLNAIVEKSKTYS